MKTLLRLFSALLLLSPCSLVMGQVQRVTADQALTGAVSITGVITPAQITANQNDYAPTGFTTATDIRLSTDASRNITGLVAPTDGKIKLLENIGSFPIVLQNENTGSTAANRFTLATATDYTMPAGTGVLVRYDLTAARWRIIGSQGGTGGGAGTVTHTAGALTANALALGNGSADLTVLGSLGTTTTVLHGNAAGAPSWAAISLTADVSGILPGANGGTNNGFLAFTGPATSLKTFTLPNVSDTIATLTAALTWTGVHGFAPTARTSGVASYFSITAPADMTLTAGTEAPGITFFGATRQHATGALSIQREYIFAASTYSFVAASTVTTAITADIADPIAGTNATFTNKYALRTASELVTGNSTIQGLLTLNQATSINPAPPTGTMFHITAADGALPYFALDAFAQRGIIQFRRANNTSASPSAVQSGNSVGTFGALGYGATSYQSSSTAALDFIATENFTDSAQGTKFSISVTPNGSITRGTVADFTSSGLAVTGSISSTTTLSVGAAFNDKFTVLTYASPTSVTVSSGNVFEVTTVNATGSVTFNASAAGTQGQHMKIIIINDATSGKTITFGTNFRSAGTLTGVVSKASSIEFDSDGTSWFEASRTVGTL